MKVWFSLHGVAHDPTHADSPPRIVFVPPSPRALHICRSRKEACHDNNSEGKLSLEALQMAKCPPSSMAQRVGILGRLDSFGDTLSCVVKIRVPAEVIHNGMMFPGLNFVDQFRYSSKGLAI